MMTMEILERILDFYNFQPKIELRLLGGEPTLHPQFTDIVEKIQGAGHWVKIFSNGIIDGKVRDFLEKKGRSGRIEIVLNVNEPGSWSPLEKTEVTATLERLHHIVLLGG